MIVSFLAKRKQYVVLNHTRSKYRSIKSGVPQDSLLGPLLIALCINDISSSTNSAPRLYADNTCLFSQDDSLLNLKYQIKEEVNVVSKWMIARLVRGKCPMR